MASAQTADINFLASQQTIEGFGGSTAWMPQMSTAQVNALYGTGSGQLGLSILRVRIDPSSTTGGGNWATELANSQEAIATGSNVKVIATPWTPPIAWKSNDSTIGGTLNTSDYAAYANYLNLFTSYMSNGGVPLYAISMQNEPDASVDYESCSWTGATMDTWIAQNASVLTAKLIMPESESFNTAYSDPALDDPNAEPYIGIVAGHLYMNGESQGTPFYYTNAENYGKQVWETEHYLTPSGSQPEIADGIQAAEEIHNSMTVGQWSAYLWWWVADWDNGGTVQNYGLVTEDPADVPTYYGLALGQFAKFIRPGYVRVSASEPVSGVYDSAYTGSGKYVIVAINSNTTATSFAVAISGADIGSFTPYQTSATENMAQISAVTVSNNSFTYSLPAQSITTFVGTLTTAPGFDVVPASDGMTVTQGGTTSNTITVTDLNGFDGSVTLAATGLPSGVTASFGTNPTTGSSILTLTATATAIPGATTFTLTGTSGSIVATDTINLAVGVAPGSSSITSGAYYTIINESSDQCILDPGGSTGGSVEQSACGAGTTEEWAFNPSSVSGYYQIAPYVSTTTGWNVVGDSSAPGTGIQLSGYSGQSNEEFEPKLLSTGYYEFIDHNSGLCVSDPNGSTTSGQQLEIETCNGAASESWALDLVPSSTPGFTLAPSASSLAVTQGSTAPDTITVTDTNGFTGSVTLAATGLPSGVTVAYGTNPTTGSSVLTFTASSSAAAGAATVTITGTSGSTSATTTITLTVNSSGVAGFTLTPSASSLSVIQGSTATDTITVTDTNGFTGSVTLAATGLPSGVTVAYGTNPTTGSSVLTFTASSTATTGAATVTITGTSGSTTATTTIMLTVNASGGTISTSAYYTFVNESSGQCATDPSGATSNGTAVEQATCVGSATQEWKFTTSAATGYYGILAYNSSSAAWNVIGNETSPGTGIQLYGYSEQSNEEFEPYLLSTGYYEFIDHNSGLCVSDPNGSTTSGQQLEIETCNGSASESWALDQVAGPGFTLSPSAGSLSIAQGGTATDTLTVTDTGGFSGSVTLAASGLPSGVTVAYGTNPTTGSSVLTFTASSTATTGAATVTITGTSGSTTASTTITLTVSAPAKTATTTTVSATPTSTTVGNTVKLSATVTGTSGTPTGTVTFYYGSDLLYTATLSGGTGSFTASTNGLPAGTYGVSATYSGDAKNLASSTTSNVNVTLKNNTTATVLTATPNPVAAGATVTLKAVVTRTSQGAAGIPGGTVNFYAGPTLLNSTPVTLNSQGQASFSASSSGLAAGSYPVQAKYSGENGDNASTSSTITVVVN
jgi:glucuronoarabinoxylan endo-1,4-beta-xylanase